jgi:hypothetical protein
VGTALDLLIEALQHVGRFEMLMMLTRQPIKRQGFVDVLLDPTGELGIFARPFGEPSGQIATGLGEIAAII